MRRVLELPAFRRLLGVSMIDQLAASSGAVALALLVYRRTGSALGATAFFLCAEFGPGLVSPALVARVDQMPVRRVIPALYLTEVLVFVALALFVHRFALAPVLVLVLIGWTVAVAAAVLVRATWTSITSASHLMRDANALVNTGFSVCLMLGPALGGGLVALGGTVTPLLVDAAGYAVCAAVIATASGLPPPSAREPAAGRLRAAIRYVRGEVMIRRLLGLQAAGLVFFAISIPVEVVLAEHTLHTGAGGYGTLLAAWGAGAIVGSVGYLRWRRRSPRVLITLGACLLGVGFLVMATAPALSVAVVGGALGGIGNGLLVVSMRTALQEAVADRWMALVLSLNQAIFQTVPGLGIVIGGLLAASAGPRVALGVGGAGSLAMAVAMWAGLSIPVHVPRAEPAPTEEAPREREESGSRLTTAAGDS